MLGGLTPAVGSKNVTIAQMRGRHLRLPRGSQLETCPWLVEFFNFMTASSADQPFAMPIPETVVFKYHRPIAWYRYNPEPPGSIVRDADGINGLTATEIFAGMVRPQRLPSMGGKALPPSQVPGRSIGRHPARVVAYYVTCRPEKGVLNPSVEYFDEQGLHEFLFERWKTKPPDDGILQRFVEPGVGEEYNSTVRVLWTPYICSMERCTNVNYIADHKLSAATRAATFDAKVRA